MRRDRNFESASIVVPWIDDQGLGPTMRTVRVVVLAFSKPGPENCVGIEVVGLGGPSLHIAGARELAAAILKAADEAEHTDVTKGGAA